MQKNYYYYYYSYRVFCPGYTISLQCEVPPSYCGASLEGAINLAKGSAERECDNGGEYNWKVYEGDPNKGGKTVCDVWGRKDLDGTISDDYSGKAEPKGSPCTFKVKKGGSR